MNNRYISLQRKLRQNMPLPEVLIWQRIRNNQLGIKFRRQYAFQNRIFDFYSPSIRLAIEIDGESHFESDRTRKQELLSDQSLLTRFGIKTIRFMNPDIMCNIDGAIEVLAKEIEILCDKQETPSQPPPEHKGRS